VRNERWDEFFIGKVCNKLSDRAADIWQPYRTSDGLCILVQRVSRMSRYYPKDIPKSNVRPVIPSTSVVL
jgi:hypothetical protein